MPPFLQYMTNSLLTLEKTQGDVDSPKGRQLYAYTSIHCITTDMRTKVLQIKEQLETLLVALSPCPAGSHGSSSLLSSTSSPESDHITPCVLARVTCQLNAP